MNSYLRISTVLTFIALVPIGCSQPKPHLGEKTSVVEAPGVSVVETETRSILPTGGLAGGERTDFTVEAEVRSIDRTTRTIVLASPNGTTHTFIAPAEVRNFSQIEPGDQVRVLYSREVTFEMREPTAEEIALSGKGAVVAGRAKPGDRPAGAAALASLAVVKVESVDKEKRHVIVKMDDGSLVTVPAKYPENLPLIKKGQKAVVTYGEVAVASVERLN